MAASLLSIPESISMSLAQISNAQGWLNAVELAACIGYSKPQAAGVPAALGRYQAVLNLAGDHSHYSVFLLSVQRGLIVPAAHFFPAIDDAKEQFCGFFSIVAGIVCFASIKADGCGFTGFS